MDSPLPPLLQASAGAIGSAVGNALVFPLDLATTRMQHARRKVSLLRTLYALTRRRGLSSLYSGLPADTLSTLLSSFTYFFLYTFLQRLFLRARTRTLPRMRTLFSDQTRKQSPAGIGGMRGPARDVLGVGLSPLVDAVEEVILGVVAGIVSKALTLPISAVCVRQQLGHRDEDEENPGDHEKITSRETVKAIKDTEKAIKDTEAGQNGNVEKSYPKQTSFFETLRTISAESGLQSLFPGLAPTVPLALLPSISLYTHTLLLRLLVPARHRAHPPVGLTFLMGAVSNAFATGLLYPLILVKSLEQGEGGKGKGKEKEIKKKKGSGLIGLGERLKEIVEKDGVKSLYKGVQGQLIKGFVQQGVMMVVKQRVEEAVVTASFVFRKRDKVY